MREFEQANLPGGGWRTFELINAQCFAKKVNLFFPYDLVINFPYCVQYISYTFIAENLMLSKVTSQVDYFFLLIIMSLHNVLSSFLVTTGNERVNGILHGFTLVSFSFAFE